MESELEKINIAKNAVSLIIRSKSMLRLYEKLNCIFTAEEKEACLPLVRRLIEINNESHRYSLLSMEDDFYNMNEEKDFFLKTAMICLLDFAGNGVEKDMELLEDILSTLIIADGSTGAELLSRLVIMQGIISIGSGEHSRLLCYRLLSMLGSQYLKNAKDYTE